MVTSYKTIKSVSESLFKEKGSKFIAIAFPVSTIEDIDLHLLNTRKKYHDARHHCYAYILGSEANIFRTNDDGEPNHSAGDPILGQIKSNNLTDVLIIVVRYFGGTKLGVSGLINAYKTAAKESLDRATIIVRAITKDLKILFPYSSMNEVMKLIDEYVIKVTTQEFDNDCKIIGKIPVQHADSVKKKSELLNQLGVKVDLFI